MWRGKANLTFSSSLFASLGRTTKMSSADTPSHNESAEDESSFEQTENEVAGVPVKQCVPTRISSSGAGIFPCCCASWCLMCSAPRNLTAPPPLPCSTSFLAGSVFQPLAQFVVDSRTFIGGCPKPSNDGAFEERLLPPRITPPPTRTPHPFILAASPHAVSTPTRFYWPRIWPGFPF